MRLRLGLGLGCKKDAYHGSWRLILRVVGGLQRVELINYVLYSAA